MLFRSLEVLTAHATGPGYRRRVAELGAAQKENYRSARAMAGANRVTALDRLIALDAPARG